MIGHGLGFFMCLGGKSWTVRIVGLFSTYSDSSTDVEFGGCCSERQFSNQSAPVVINNQPSFIECSGNRIKQLLSMLQPIFWNSLEGIYPASFFVQHPSSGLIGNSRHTLVWMTSVVKFQDPGWRQTSVVDEWFEGCDSLLGPVIKCGLPSAAVCQLPAS